MAIELAERLADEHGTRAAMRLHGGLVLHFASITRGLAYARDLCAAAQKAGVLPGVGLDICLAEELSEEAARKAEALAHRAGAGDFLLSGAAQAVIQEDEGRVLGSCKRHRDPDGGPAATLEGGDAEPASYYCFDDFALDPARFELQRRGEVVPLQPRTFDLLLLLIRNHDRTVTRDEIFRRLWRGRVVSDTALSSQVKMLRQALGDRNRDRQVIRTVQGRGFRFLPNVVRRAQPVAQAAERTSEARATPRPLVAVLPLKNLSDDSNGHFFADGLSEDILNALSKHRWIDVVARNSAFSFGNPAEGMDEIAAKLGATHLVTGVLRKRRDRLRVTIEAVEASPPRRLWAESFDLTVDDVFEFQDEVCGKIAARLATELGLSEVQKARTVRRESRGAWELYHLGLAEFHAFTAQSNRRAQQFLRLAIRSDPLFAEPYSRLAYAIALEMVYFDGMVSQTRLDDALELVLRGLDLDDRDPQAHFTLGRLRLVRREYDLSIDALEQALELNPHLAVSHCGLGDSLALEGRTEEAIGHFKRAIELSPHDPFRWAFYAYMSLAYLFAADWEAAARVARRSIQVPNAHFSAHANLLAALGHLGSPDQAGIAREALLRARPGFTLEQARARLFYIKRREQLETYLDGLARGGLE